jgi:hypothetical protein
VANEALIGAKLDKVLTALEGNWQAEMKGHQTYQTLADRDTDTVRAQVLRHLAGALVQNPREFLRHPLIIVCILRSDPM